MLDSKIVSWLSPDPADQYYSSYLGMGNNPTNRVDSDGGLDEWRRNVDGSLTWLTSKGGESIQYIHCGDNTEIWLGNFNSCVSFAGSFPRFFIPNDYKFDRAILDYFSDGQNRGGHAAIDVVGVFNSVLAFGVDYLVSDLIKTQKNNKKLWDFAHKTHSSLKKLGWKVPTATIKKAVKPTLANVSVKSTILGGVLIARDVVMDGEIRPSHTIDAVMMAVTAVPRWGWAVGGTYFAADLITIAVSGESLENI